MTNTEFYYRSVSQFMVTFDQKQYRYTSDVPNAVIKLRGKLIQEEYNEYIKAIHDQNRLEMLDGICDLAYVIAGTMYACSVSPLPFTADRNGNAQFDFGSKIHHLINECNISVPCHRRMYAAANQALMCVDSIGLLNGFKFREAFEIVHNNNMMKLWTNKPTDPTLVATPRSGKWLVRNKDGKVIKPPDHPKPNLTPYL